MSALRGEWRHNYPMSRMTTWRAGGPARDLFLPADANDLESFYLNDGRAADSCCIGHGSNLLVRDGGFDGVMVRAAPGLSQLDVLSDGVYAEAGVGCPKLARRAAAEGFADAAFLAGVPGTVGGALAMNAGCEGAAVWDYVDKVRVLQDGETRTLTTADFTPGYRSLKVNRGGAPFFMAAWFKFSPGDAESAGERVRALLKKRGQTQPIGEANCGSVFCNPPGGHAAKLIDECGLKGAAVGAATVSDKHANFIINTGGATAADIESLMLLVQKIVREKTGVSLIPEVRIVGKS